MSSIKKEILKVEKIKTDFYQPENSELFITALGKLTKAIYPLEMPVVHRGTMQLIANGHYLQVASAEGRKEMEVAIAEFPKEHLLHAIAMHWKPTRKFATMFRFIGTFMEYYSLTNGEGAQYREALSDLTLRELVAQIFGTNKTYLDWIEAIGNYRQELLELVDAGEVSLKEAFAMVPKETKRKKHSGGEPGGNAGRVIKMNYQVPVTEIASLTTEEIQTLCANLPSNFAQEIGNARLPEQLSISKCFTHADIFQGFSIVYENYGKSVITHIAYTDEMRTILLKAA